MLQSQWLRAIRTTWTIQQRVCKQLHSRVHVECPGLDRESHKPLTLVDGGNQSYTLSAYES